MKQKFKKVKIDSISLKDNVLRNILLIIIEYFPICRQLISSTSKNFNKIIEIYDL